MILHQTRMPVEETEAGILTLCGEWEERKYHADTMEAVNCGRCKLRRPKPYDQRGWQPE